MIHQWFFILFNDNRCMSIGFYFLTCKTALHECKYKQEYFIKEHEWSNSRIMHEHKYKQTKLQHFFSFIIYIFSEN